MSDDDVHGTPNRKAEAFLEEFRELSTRDQDLVIALVARLRWTVAEPTSDFPPDVAFMDFDE